VAPAEDDCKEMPASIGEGGPFLNPWQISLGLSGLHTTKGCTNRRVRLFADSGQDTPRLESDFRTRGHNRWSLLPNVVSGIARSAIQSEPSLTKFPVRFHRAGSLGCRASSKVRKWHT
jgi:hypothetical protein